MGKLNGSQVLAFFHHNLEKLSEINLYLASIKMSMIGKKF